jgi:hypothetical protein
MLVKANLEMISKCTSRRLESRCGQYWKGTAMQIVVGPVLTRKGGYAFDCWTPEEGFSRGYAYSRIEDAHYARNVEIRFRKKGYLEISTGTSPEGEREFRRCPRPREAIRQALTHLLQQAWNIPATPPRVLPLASMRMRQQTRRQDVRGYGASG